MQKFFQFFTSWCQMNQFWFPGKYLLIFWGFFWSQVHETSPVFRSASSDRNADTHPLCVVGSLFHPHLLALWGYIFNKYIHGFFILLSQFFLYYAFPYSINKWVVYFVSVFSCICWALIWLYPLLYLFLFIG